MTNGWGWEWGQKDQSSQSCSTCSPSPLWPPSALLLQDGTGVAPPWSVPDLPATGEGLDDSLTWVPSSTHTLPPPPSAQPPSRSCGL